LLVDGHTYAYRSFHAIRNLSSPTGQPTNAIFGFIKAVTSLMASLAPSHTAVVWDGGLAAERLALLPAYKAQRPPMPPGLAAQLEGIVAWLTASGIASLCQEGIEADDAIATLASGGAAAAQVVIASSDKDFYQLVSPRIGLLNPNDKAGRVWSAEDVVAKTGVCPAQIVDWLCLVGDAVDNIPGIAGVGPKTAAALLQEFGTCGELLLRASEVKSDRVRTALLEGAARLNRNRQMIRLKTDLVLPLSFDQTVPRPPQLSRLASLYRAWGFRSLLAAVESDESRQATLGI
jgi:DNA polymerase-1